MEVDEWGFRSSTFGRFAFGVAVEGSGYANNSRAGQRYFVDANTGK